MVGAADALSDTARALRRTDIDDEIDIAPINAQIERRRTDHGFELARRHGGFDFAALAGIERAMMQSNGEIVVVDRPELLEDGFGLGARVDEHQGHARRFDGGVDFAHRMQRAVARPGRRSRVSSILMSASAPAGVVTSAASFLSSFCVTR